MATVKRDYYEILGVVKTADGEGDQALLIAAWR